MHIIIPMSGRGQRFVDVGYTDPKPLIKVDGMPIIEHVAGMFPGESKFTFICSEDHLKTTSMRKELTRIKPHANIIAIAPHKKGPVYAVSKAFESIDDKEEAIINYCDFSCYWDYAGFLQHTRNRKADGAIPCYRNFHPHMIGDKNYAFLREENQWMLEIQEKKPFTKNRMQEYASSGTYYFRTGSIVKKYFQKIMDEDLNLNGEFYVSMVYNLLQEDNLKTSIFEIQHMLQWGIPEDLEEYQQWSDYFRALIKSHETMNAQKNSINLIPMAGAGKRFSDAGYTTPKPLLKVSGYPMIVQATRALPPAEKNIFVCQKEHVATYPIESELVKVFKGVKIVEIDGLTEGQACTCELGLDGLDLDAPLFIGASDNSMLFNHKKYVGLLEDESVDAIAMSFRHHISAKLNPRMYGWIQTKGNKITGVSVKVPISDNPFEDHAIVGAFYFRKVHYFLDALQSLYKKNKRVNNEFYVDSCIDELVKMGRNVHVFETDQYICWGTPNDYETFIYWQSFFHKVSWHPYSLELDRTVRSQSVQELDMQFKKFQQSFN